VTVVKYLGCEFIFQVISWPWPGSDSECIGMKILTSDILTNRRVCINHVVWSKTKFLSRVGGFRALHGQFWSVQFSTDQCSGHSSNRCLLPHWFSLRRLAPRSTMMLIHRTGCPTGRKFLAQCSGSPAIGRRRATEHTQLTSFKKCLILSVSNTISCLLASWFLMMRT